MSREKHHTILPEHHVSQRSAWLRAMVLGANDGIISISSLLLAVAAASQSHQVLMISGFGGLVAGALSMAAGEYVSVSSQSDAERADMHIELKALKEQPLEELEELANIYINRGLTEETAKEVAKQLSAYDALGSHMRDELGITEMTAANPLQAAIFSAVSFLVGGGIPLVASLLAGASLSAVSVIAITLFALSLLGWFSASLSAAKKFRSVSRIILLGMAAMGISWAAGALFGAVV
jgi:VIT1/CCC1 family predicted Fe2+/Mn2+ transporter